MTARRGGESEINSGITEGEKLTKKG